MRADEERRHRWPFPVLDGGGDGKNVVEGPASRTKRASGRRPAVPGKFVRQVLGSLP
jgi:hypothetical protein